MRFMISWQNTSQLDTMAGKRWCKCNRCDGGRFVAKTTWYMHNPRRVCHRHGTWDVGSNPPADIYLKEPLEDVDVPDDVGWVPRLDLVSLILSTCTHCVCWSSSLQDMDNGPQGHQASPQTSRPPTPCLPSSPHGSLHHSQSPPCPPEPLLPPQPPSSPCSQPSPVPPDFN